MAMGAIERGLRRRWSLGRMTMVMECLMSTVTILRHYLAVLSSVDGR
jgi:hypothetical protein